MFKAKIVVVGPCETGKTVLSNFLGDQTDSARQVYHTTAGVRILEFENLVNNGQNSTNIDVELWDCGGSENLESCWPAMAFEADGVIIVFDPYKSKSTPSIPTFYNYFVANKGLKDSQCLLFANCFTKEPKTMTSPIPSLTANLTNVEKNPDGITDLFQKLLQNIVGKMSDSREKEELSIIG